MECTRAPDTTVRALIPCLLCFLCTALPAMSSETPAKSVRDDLALMSHYYLRPVPGSVPGILERLASSRYLSDRMDAGDDLSGTAYLFARVARAEPGLPVRYRELFQKTGHSGRVFLIRVFVLMGGEDITAYLREKLSDRRFEQEKGEIMHALASLPAGADVYRMPLEKAADLDLLWAEFMVTGDAKAVERVIEVLERPDITRERFEHYLGTRTVDQGDGLVAAIRNNLWVLCDAGRGKVITCKDLDISLVVFSLRPEHPREAVRFMREALGIDDAAYYGAALKASAAWSLMSNAMEHPRILRICTDNARKKGTAVKLALLCVPACFYEDHLLIDDALAAFSSMAEADPSNVDIHLHLMSLAMEKRDLEAARRELAFIRGKGLDPGREVIRELAFLEKLLLNREGLKEIPGPVDIPAIVRETVRRTLLFGSYSSEVFIIPDPLPPGIGCTSPVKFGMEYEKPDRFSVSRRMISNPRALPVNEKWITLGSENYSHARKWYKVPGLIGGQDKTNAMLRIDKWARLLEANAIREVKLFAFEGKRYYCMSFPVEHADETLADLVSAGRKGTAEVWIEAGTHMIVKCEIRSVAHDAKGNKLGMILQQVFHDFDSAGPVGPPEDFTDLSRGRTRGVM